ncbi:hypothetical protein FF011L_49380 [Roseimaritima multifibrata]|uniref:Uncharacterized protein n=1 Tax=Roseimaritima multifibrata TaxID=1930274 RepID=A0A517MMN0_9BACT|nr:hypothetical protein [Roseimaritima multifibrata]QDS96131.1 hypothetical protein FF011L_49380 [Roseimaritima multifibrata]
MDTSSRTSSLNRVTVTQKLMLRFYVGHWLLVIRRVSKESDKITFFLAYQAVDLTEPAESVSPFARDAKFIADGFRAKWFLFVSAGLVLVGTTTGSYFNACPHSILLRQPRIA